MPLTWGAVTGLGLRCGRNEPLLVRRIGERLMMGVILLYLIVGVLAGENLKTWLDRFPDEVRVVLLRSFAALHTHNPFGILRFWLDNNIEITWPSMVGAQCAGLA